MTQPNPSPARRSRRSRRPLLAVGIAVLLAAGAAAGATAVFSARTQTLAEDWTNKLVTSARASEAVQVEQTGYVRGLSESTQTLTVTLDPKSAGGKTQLLVINHIQHGPFPGFSKVAQAVIDTEIRFADAKIQSGIDRTFAGKKPQIKTVIGLGGASDTQINVPEGQFAEGGDSVTWQALAGQIDVSGNQSITTLNWPGLSFTSADGGGSLKDLSLSGKTARNGQDDVLGVGDSALKIGEISLNGDGLQGAVRGLEISASSQASGKDFYDALLRYNVASFEMPGQSLSNLQLHLSARHLAREPLNRLGKLLNEVQAGGAAASDQPLTETQLTDAQTKELGDGVLALLKGVPVFQIDRLSVGEPGQDVVLTGQASLPGAGKLSAADLKVLGQQPMAAVGELDLRANLKGSERAVKALASQFGGPLSGLEDNLQALIDAGYVRRSGDQLSVDVASAAGQTTLNGQTLGDF